ncbi:hypothetical protein KSP39_PZI022550 [Platanthera zijinensis]|uniref:Uncharacterized protein n=1 Tax=Platanthera zijinensis TaxID=2320716 RepID=A0AAP0AVA1_9ASPA
MASTSPKNLPLIVCLFTFLFLMLIFKSECARVLESAEPSDAPMSSSSSSPLKKPSCSRKSYPWCRYMDNETPATNNGHSPSIGHNVSPELLI